MQVRFKLTQFFSVTSLIAFACVAGAMVYFQTRESSVMETAQNDAAQTFSVMGDQLAELADNATRHGVLSTHQESNIQLARVLSNALWDETLAPFFGSAKKVEFGSCRNPSERASSVEAPQATAQVQPQAQACQKQQSTQLRALPAYAALDARLQRAMRDSSIASIRIHDLQGTTLYSTDPTDVGTDVSSLVGWGQAVGGLPSSTRLQETPPSSSQGEDHRDLMASLVPVIDPRTNATVAVFEVRSHSATHLDRMRQASADIQTAAADHQARMEQLSLAQRNQAQRSEQVQLVTLTGLLVLLYASLYSIVRRAQAAIEQQAQESDATKQRLAQSEKMTSLGNMVASVAHQLNTPLAFSKSNVSMAIQALNDMAPSIRSAAQALDRAVTAEGGAAASKPLDIDADSLRAQLSQCPDELSMTQDMLGDVLTGLNQMNEMVDNLRSFTRMDRSRTAEVDLNTTLASVIYIARAVISTKIRVVQKFSPLPRLECQVSQLNQVFLNLIMNAAQAIEEAGVVTVSTATHGRFIRITVEDTGSGIPADVLPRIFEPYFTTKPQGIGTGLGLAIARDIVAEHGGTLTVNSQVGSGTTFQIELPIPTGPSA